MSKSKSNLSVLEDFVSKHDWIDFLAKDPLTRSNTSVCLTLQLDKDELKKYVGLLEDEKVAFDIASYRDAPDG
jgi:phosphoserine aminotransferase